MVKMVQRSKSLARNRSIRFKEMGGQCEHCGRKATVIHHKDKTRDNSLDNLMALCHGCHLSFFHKGDMGKPTKYSSLSLAKIAIKANCNISIAHLHLCGKKKSKKHGELIDKIVAENPVDAR